MLLLKNEYNLIIRQLSVNDCRDEPGYLFTNFQPPGAAMLVVCTIRGLACYEIPYLYAQYY
ncbi:MAG: hypothetical protein A2X11_06595 [Bacteroidetes bacterium GWE2_42_24]|nr:MAG: hypothetical protein A2X11_06595 [Bacteroidetes bacterium GWE2_42_24]OFY25679.1 MAG: hypothetical protein A2X09_01820 [Bacteroidetes bacterium GWF2_43_11]